MSNRAKDYIQWKWCVIREGMWPIDQWSMVDEINICLTIRESEASHQSQKVLPGIWAIGRNLKQKHYKALKNRG